MKDKPFFVGYLPVPSALKHYLLGITLIFAIGSAALGYTIGASQDNPGPAALRFDFGPQTLEGVLELTPTPLLHVTKGTNRFPEGRVLMLAGQGKNGAVARAKSLEGQLVTARGIILQRGDMDMLQLNGGNNNFRAVEDQSNVPEVPASEPLGKWRMAGEICDGKCTAGAMRPGRGLAHKACANLCITGGTPPVFVTSQPIMGEEFLLITGEGDQTLPTALFDYVGVYVTLEGDVARHGDILVMTVDQDSVELVP